ncbi:leucine-rich repeat extensin-like protein 7 [Iris pallida]|uniref:Leucine-rich repeat extensin-like protein 7 n=1 Tax=Iris pallida TaxID=29817 RepID=A0AAX6H4P9_IRIPA|nr:leucine-rich repeat extensin-like protein 7 [Iris pallida]
MRMYSDVKNWLRSVDADTDADARGWTRGWARWLLW